MRPFRLAPLVGLAPGLVVDGAFVRGFLDVPEEAAARQSGVHDADEASWTTDTTN